MCTIFSIFNIRLARFPGSSIILNPFMQSASMKSFSRNSPMFVMLNRRFSGFFLAVRTSIAVASMSSRANMYVFAMTASSIAPIPMMIMSSSLSFECSFLSSVNFHRTNDFMVSSPFLFFCGGVWLFGVLFF